MAPQKHPTTSPKKNDPRITKVLLWYTKNGRTFPWRNADDAYKIFVSEIMLQQTQVSRVIPIFESWIKKFPNWKALAHAKTDVLIRAWSGLGYNRRALYLRESARTVCEKGVPDTEEEWRMLKGVGPYTAAAVYTFTSKTPASAIDTNIRRVIGRIVLGDPYPAPEKDILIKKHLDSMLSPRAWKALHAMMDFGSLICTARNPNCRACPLQKTCASSKHFLLGSPKKKNEIHFESRHDGKSFPDRIYRGRILKLIQTRKRVHVEHVGSLVDETYSADKDQDWIERMIHRLHRDGLLERDTFFIKLPST